MHTISLNYMSHVAVFGGFPIRLDPNWRLSRNISSAAEQLCVCL